MRDFASVAAFVKRLEPDFVVHAAGKVGGIHANISAPVDFLVENMDMGRNMTPSLLYLLLIILTMVVDHGTFFHAI